MDARRKGLAAVAWLALTGPIPASAAATATHDCEDARLLPADAGDDARRITCTIPEKYRYDVTMAEFVGIRIRLHDMAAWLTTDALQQARAFEDMPGQGRGWLTRMDDESVEVRYFNEYEGVVVAIASASLDIQSAKARDARKLEPPGPATAREARLMRARTLALEADGLFLCSPRLPNVAIFEMDDRGKSEILVFVMSAWLDPAKSPLGGYHMLRINHDATQVIDHYSQTDSCSAADLGDDKLTELAVTHTTSMTPTMFHVFMGLQYGRPIVVSTTQNGLSWRVDGGQVSLQPRRDDVGKQAAGADAHPRSSGP